MNDGRSLSHRISNFPLSYRATPHATTNRPPCSLFLSRTVRTKLSLVYPNVESHVLGKQTTQEQQHNQHAKTRTFNVGQAVMAHNYRPGNKWVPGILKKQLGPVTFLVETEQGQIWKRHIDQLQNRQILQLTPIDQPTQPSDIDSGYIAPSDITTAPTEDTPDPNQTIYHNQVRNPPERFM